VIKATENCDEDDTSTVVFASEDDSLLAVEVAVVDVDDSPPVFVRKVFTGGVATDAPSDFGAPFARVAALDADEGENAELEFTLEGPVEPSRDSEGLDEVGSNPFAVDPRSGDISLNFDPHKGMKVRDRC